MGFTNFPPTLLVTGSVKITTPIELAPGSSVAITGGTVDATLTGPVTVQKITEAVIANVNELPTPPSSITGLLSVRVSARGGLTRVQCPAFTLKTGCAFWTPRSNHGVIYIGGSTVTGNSGGITPGGSATWPLSAATIFWILGTTGDVVNLGGA